MNEHPRIYLDHAATSWPKSEAVIEAMADFMRNCGAAAGRGGYASAARADSVVATVRRQIASLIGAESSECISFHSNGTAALNAAIHGVLRNGDHVVTCASEHNSVLRPLNFLRHRGEATVSVVPTDESGRVDPQQLIEQIEPNTKLVTLTHASNVTGAVQPIAEIADALRDRETLLLVDAAQTLGTIDVKVEGIDLLAAPGHKATGGPLGTGFLYVAPRAHDHVIPFIQGGTGSQSESLGMPLAMPGKLESGNQNVPALAGWSVALQELIDEGIQSRSATAAELSKYLHDSLRSIESVRVYGQPGELPIASVSIDGLAPTDAAAILDAEHGIETRAGMHCAALIHKFIGSETEGTLRISAGHTTTKSEITAATNAIRAIAVALNP